MNKNHINSTHFREFLKKFTPLVKFKRFVWYIFNLDRARGSTTADITKLFPLYEAAGLGTYKQRASLTIDCVNQTIPLLYKIVGGEKNTISEIENIEDIELSEEQKRTASVLANLFNKYGSDKASTNNYHLVYALVLKEDASNVLEIGLGTNNARFVSHMGNTGHPGSSLRAFRDFLPTANIYGADIDKEILFSEEGIQTFWTDQTSESAMDSLSKNLPDGFDLIIDDGLHSVHANLRTLEFSLKKLSVGGSVVIEDIGKPAAPVWRLIENLLPKETYKTQLFQTKSALVFVVKKIT